MLLKYLTSFEHCYSSKQCFRYLHLNATSESLRIFTCSVDSILPTTFVMRYRITSSKVENE